jgi:hypothetical protein
MVTTIGIRAKSTMAEVGTSSAKFNVMKFDGTGNFGLWQRRVKVFFSAIKDDESYIWDKTK